MSQKHLALNTIKLVLAVGQKISTRACVDGVTATFVALIPPIRTGYRCYEKQITPFRKLIPDSPPILIKLFNIFASTDKKL